MKVLKNGGFFLLSKKNLIFTEPQKHYMDPYIVQQVVNPVSAMFPMGTLY